MNFAGNGRIGFLVAIFARMFARGTINHWCHQSLNFIPGPVYQELTGSSSRIWMKELSDKYLTGHLLCAADGQEFYGTLSFLRNDGFL